MKKDLFNRNIISLKPSASLVFMAKAKQMKKDGIDVVDLAGGEPDFATPMSVVNETYQQMVCGFTHYTVGQGIPELLDSISKKLREENGIICAPNEILVTPGGKNAIFLAAHTLINPGDEVMYLDPAWVSYSPIIESAGGIAVPVVLSYEDDYRITLEELNRKATEKTKLLIINYPNNPTGKILKTEEAEVLRDFLIQHPDVLLLSDEVYEKIIFDGNKHISPASFPEIRDRVITVNGFSKCMAMTGWRLGYMAAPGYIIENVYRLYQHSLSCVSGFLQKGAVIALEEKDEMERMRRSYEERRNIFIEKLNKIDGLEAKMPEGAFYAWVKCTVPEISSAELCTWLLEKAKVVGVPGDSYGEGGKGCIRFSFANSMEDLEEAARRIKKAMDEWECVKQHGNT